MLSVNTFATDTKQKERKCRDRLTSKGKGEGSGYRGYWMFGLTDGPTVLPEGARVLSSRNCKGSPIHLGHWNASAECKAFSRALSRRQGAAVCLHRMTEFSVAALSCFALSRYTVFTEVLRIQPEDRLAHTIHFSRQ